MNWVEWIETWNQNEASMKPQEILTSLFVGEEKDLKIKRGS